MPDCLAVVAFLTRDYRDSLSARLLTFHTVIFGARLSLAKGDGGIVGNGQTWSVRDDHGEDDASGHPTFFLDNLAR